jgi:hypothetical protein
MRMTILTRRVLAAAAATTLAFGVVACADDGGDAGNETVTATDTAGEETEIERDEVEATTPSIEDDADATDDEEAEGTEPTGEEVEYETSEGTVAIPAAAAASFDEFAADWGPPETIETNNIGQSLAIFPDGNMVSFTEETGGVPLGGEIGSAWLEEGGLESTLGVPTAPEGAAPDGNGWVQQFENGTISWVSDEDGEFSADIQEDES